MGADFGMGEGEKALQGIFVFNIFLFFPTFLAFLHGALSKESPFFVFCFSNVYFGFLDGALPKESQNMFF